MSYGAKRRDKMMRMYYSIALFSPGHSVMGCLKCLMHCHFGPLSYIIHVNERVLPLFRLPSILPWRISLVVVNLLLLIWSKYVSLLFMTKP